MQTAKPENPLEEIDELEESARIQVEEVDMTPIKTNRGGMPTLNFNGLAPGEFISGRNSAFRPSGRDTLRSSFMDMHHLTHRDMDETSSQMCSQMGSPFRKSRRTRDERRKATHQESCDNQYNASTMMNEEGGMINVSPLKKEHIQEQEPSLRFSSIITPQAKYVVKVEINEKENEEVHEQENIMPQADMASKTSKESSGIKPFKTG